jgi:hypothetical protein
LSISAQNKVEKWRICEIALKGEAKGNPFTDVQLSAVFTNGSPTKSVAGFNAIVYDECRYEGNINWSWVNLTAQKMVNKFWRGFINGGYVGHGETYDMENSVKWGSQSDAVITSHPMLRTKWKSSMHGI